MCLKYVRAQPTVDDDKDFSQIRVIVMVVTLDEELMVCFLMRMRNVGRWYQPCYYFLANTNAGFEKIKIVDETTISTITNVEPNLRLDRIEGLPPFIYNKIGLIFQLICS